MKIDVKCNWNDKDMKTFLHLEKKGFVITVDLDYIEDIDDFKRVVVDEIHSKFGIVITNFKELDDMIQNWDEIYDCIDYLFTV